MSVAEPSAPPTARPDPRKTPVWRRVMHPVRRGHLYLGLFLMPWAVLYGVTGFLFNHPAAFSDTPATPFAADVLAGTPMAEPPSAAATAEQVVAALNERAKGGVSYTLAADPPPAYARDLASATVRVDDGTQLTVFVEVLGNGGMVRGPTARQESKAPFAVGGGPGRRGRGGETARPRDALELADPLHERVKAALPTALGRLGLPAGEVTVTAVPDLLFRVTDAEGKAWKVTANTLTGAVAGGPVDDAGEVSARRFLTRLHTTHGYPSSGGVRWWWAVVVDAMAFVMVFWGVSGLLMWWQIKATRTLGLLTLLLSAAAAAWLVIGMLDAVRF